MRVRPNEGEEKVGEVVGVGQEFLIEHLQRISFILAELIDQVLAQRLLAWKSARRHDAKGALNDVRTCVGANCPQGARHRVD